MRYKQATRNNILKAAKHLGLGQNLCIRVLDEATGEVLQEHVCHNVATNSLLLGIAHHLIGDFFPDQHHGLSPGYPLLSNYVPRYISLGTMGLINQDQDEQGLPAGIGVTIPDIDDPEYRALVEALNTAKAELDAAIAALENDCPYYAENGSCYTGEICQQCSDRLDSKREALELARANYDAAYQALMDYSEEQRFVDYMNTRPGYGADGYDANENNGRKYLGLGYAFTSYDVNDKYVAGDIVSYKGTVYECVNATADMAGPFDPARWQAIPDADQPSRAGTTINLELISPSFPRELISFRDIVPEYEAELPKTIDVVFSAMISTGALAQFRPEGQDYIFITEAGLWSKRDWEDSGENGLLAAYRLAPPHESNWPMSKEAVDAYIEAHPDFVYPPGVTTPTEYAAYNRNLLKQQVLRVGRNQVVQVVWKIQLGSIDDFGVKDCDGRYIVWRSYTDTSSWNSGD